MICSFFDTGAVDRLHLPIYKAWVKVRLISPGVYETISSGSTIRADNWTDAVPLELCKWLNLIYGILLLCPQHSKVTRNLYSYYALWGVWLPILVLVFPPDAYTFGNYYYWAHYGNHALIIAVCWWMHLYGTQVMIKTNFGKFNNVFNIRFVGVIIFSNSKWEFSIYG